MSIFCCIDITVVIFVIAAIALLAVFLRSDADLICMLMTKYGKQPESLKGKVIWITGSSSGIGENMAYCLANAGAKLVLSARRKEELERVKKACLSSSKCQTKEDDILILPLDLIKFESHKAAVQQVLEYFNVIDILINNAGREQNGPWTEGQLSVDRQIFEINVLGPVSLTQEVLPHMMERKQGQVVVTSSLVGKGALPNCRSYTGSKHALHGYFECLRSEVIDHNIGVTMICPGPVVSNLRTAGVTTKAGEVKDFIEENKFKNMSTDRCAHLSCVAIANRLAETWVVEQPFLFMVYILQYAPAVYRSAFFQRQLKKSVPSSD